MDRAYYEKVSEESIALNAEKKANWAGRYEGHILLAIIVTVITLSIGVRNAMVLFIFVSFVFTAFAYWLEGKIRSTNENTVL